MPSASPNSEKLLCLCGVNYLSNGHCCMLTRKFRSKREERRIAVCHGRTLSVIEIGEEF